MKDPLRAENHGVPVEEDCVKKFTVRECLSDGSSNVADVLVEESTAAPYNSLCDMLIEYLPDDDADPLLSATDLSKFGTNSSVHSRTSSVGWSYPSVEESDLSMISDGQSSLLSFPLDDELLRVELPADNELKTLVALDSAPTPSPSEQSELSYTTLRVTYLLVTLVIMLADGLQGTSCDAIPCAVEERVLCVSPNTRTDDFIFNVRDAPLRTL